MAQNILLVHQVQKKTGVDCSGLVIQAMYAAGVAIGNINPVQHARPQYEYFSSYLWSSPKLKTVSYKNKARGDLIFYKGKSGIVNHVTIYLGNGRVIESWPNYVIVAKIKNSQRNAIKGVKRIFV